jgi:hypothetical protein
LQFNNITPISKKHYTIFEKCSKSVGFGNSNTAIDKKARRKSSAAGSKIN